MRTHLDCLPCVVRQAVEAARTAVVDPPSQQQLLRRILALLSRTELHVTPPRLVQATQRILRQTSGLADPYAAVKQRFNAVALALAPGLAARIRRAADPFEQGLRVALAGNVIDAGAYGDLTADRVAANLAEIQTAELDGEAVGALRAEVQRASRILYLADNCGEIVCDRLFIEHALPRDKTTVVVRGAPVLNDATLDDARLVGLTDVVRTVDNGSDAPGTILEDCHLHMQELFHRADLIISKGQGNWESLSEVPANIFFLLKVKCAVAADNLECPEGAWMVRPGVGTTGDARCARPILPSRGLHETAGDT